MNPIWNEMLWGHLGAAIDMLENAMRACPDDLWSDPSKKPEWPARDVVGFWYLAFHSLFFLDFYTSDSLESFTPPAPFNRDELDPAGLLPDKPYSKEELLGYLNHCRVKCRAKVEALTEEGEAEPILKNMRHVQHHVAQLHYLLRMNTGAAPRWVATAKR